MKYTHMGALIWVHSYIYTHTFYRLHYNIKDILVGANKSSQYGIQYGIIYIIIYVITHNIYYNICTFIIYIL